MQIIDGKTSQGDEITFCNLSGMQNEIHKYSKCLLFDIKVYNITFNLILYNNFCQNTFMSMWTC